MPRISLHKEFDWKTKTYQVKMGDEPSRYLWMTVSEASNLRDRLTKLLSDIRTKGVPKNPTLEKD